MQVVASERSGAAGESRAVEAFPESPDHLCDGRWHSVKANFIGRSISLKVDNFPNVDSLVDSTVRIDGNWREVTGTLFIGGDGKSRPFPPFLTRSLLQSINFCRWEDPLEAGWIPRLH